MKTLTIQALLDNTWQDIALLYLDAPDKGSNGACRLEYQLDYALQHLEQRDEHACSVSLPVQVMIQHESKTWFGFLDDMVPSGAARRYWVHYLGLQALSEQQQNSILLEKGTIAPVGNLRIKEALQPLPVESTLGLRRFNVKDVVERNSDFLEYAQQMGAISGGATGAGGEAPKLLLRLTSEQQVWIDTYQNRFDQLDAHYLVKFPRNQRSQIDCDILTAEYYFYCILNDLGFNTIAKDGLMLHQGSRYPSLWMPRFDTSWDGFSWQRFGLESVYSILGVAAGSTLNHFEVIDRLCHLMRIVNPSFNSAAFVCEWVKRDLLNIIFGNSDNHGRNTSFIKKSGVIELAPIYDFAPMKVDPEDIIRSTKWGSPYEEGGEYRWQAICEKLNPWCPADESFAALQGLAQQLHTLQQRLGDYPVPQSILTMPALGFDYIPDKLKRWQLL